MAPPSSSDWRIISMRCLLTERNSRCDWHTHAFDELCLTSESGTTNGFCEHRIATEPDTVMLFRAGERHGYWNGAAQVPRFWVIHFTAPRGFFEASPAFQDPNPLNRTWKLTQSQAAEFRGTFLRIFRERTSERRLAGLAETAWLQLLLVSLQRWSAKEQTQSILPESHDVGLLKMWHIINENVSNPELLSQLLRAVPNYDRLRHEFRERFGHAPGQMAMHLRMEQAKNLLLETSLSIKEIATLVGYARQHEFTRAFGKHVGRSPTQWRSDPVAHGHSFEALTGLG
ncbi:helix-turn-helix transcriptional regulator [Nibricoccus sp. IMCC34717]|uniref:AraC family transcriptional regulator n=1 Tax=Nibricoccus sp. IMCC34717 TaxID=3034021 RepID=UPI00384F350E